MSLRPWDTLKSIRVHARKYDDIQWRRSGRHDSAISYGTKPSCFEPRLSFHHPSTRQPYRIRCNNPWALPRCVSHYGVELTRPSIFWRYRLMISILPGLTPRWIFWRRNIRKGEYILYFLSEDALNISNKIIFNRFNLIISPSPWKWIWMEKYLFVVTWSKWTDLVQNIFPNILIYNDSLKLVEGLSNVSNIFQTWSLENCSENYRDFPKSDEKLSRLRGTKTLDGRLIVALAKCLEGCCNPFIRFSEGLSPIFDGSRSPYSKSSKHYYFVVALSY